MTPDDYGKIIRLFVSDFDDATTKLPNLALGAPVSFASSDEDANELIAGDRAKRRLE